MEGLHEALPTEFFDVSSRVLWWSLDFIWAHFRLFAFNIMGIVSLHFWMQKQREGDMDISFFYGVKKRVLILTAHPMDECMFFTPTLLKLRRLGHQVHVLCLSTGNAEGLGEIRTHELVESCKHFGIAHNQIDILDDPSFPDGDNVSWPIEQISRAILDHCRLHPIDAIITFDIYGGTSHLNHVACNRGLRRLIRSGELVHTRAYQLASVGGLRKYMGPVDFLWTFATFPLIHFHSLVKGYWAAHRAMRQHKSQYTLACRIYILFSRYVYINTLEPIH
eukprot:TRINITY_DN8578_c0_g1_i2.p1 TRINITY_DN8578_c0_g1~~TRINITY_DN8578_c0_g1_i2.p1  ORF type:complete len:278 (+),score=36.85 TRINITY_DN8578_c0_g1_i2:46-879(+)